MPGVALLLISVGAALPFMALVHVASGSDVEWETAGHSRVIWTLAPVLLGPIGAIVYFAVIWPQLRAAAKVVAFSTR